MVILAAEVAEPIAARPTEEKAGQLLATSVVSRLSMHRDVDHAGRLVRQSRRPLLTLLESAQIAVDLDIELLELGVIRFRQTRELIGAKLNARFESTAVRRLQTTDVSKIRQ